MLCTNVHMCVWICCFGTRCCTFYVCTYVHMYVCIFILYRVIRWLPGKHNLFTSLLGIQLNCSVRVMNMSVCTHVCGTEVSMCCLTATMLFDVRVCYGVTVTHPRCVHPPTVVGEHSTAGVNANHTAWPTPSLFSAHGHEKATV